MKLPKYEVVMAVDGSYIVIDSNKVHTPGSLFLCTDDNSYSMVFLGGTQRLGQEFADAVCRNMNESVKCVQEQYDAALSSILKDSKDR